MFLVVLIVVVAVVLLVVLMVKKYCFILLKSTFINWTGCDANCETACSSCSGCSDYGSASN